MTPLSIPLQPAIPLPRPYSVNPQAIIFQFFGNQQLYLWAVLSYFVSEAAANSKAVATHLSSSSSGGPDAFFDPLHLRLSRINCQAALTHFFT